RLAASGAPDLELTFMARGAHLEAMRARGLQIRSPKGDVHVPHVAATDDPSTVGAVDVVLFTVKLYDMEAALELLPPLIGPDTVVLPLQNGVDAVEILRRAVGREHTAG